jgi:hypothetical protein
MRISGAVQKSNLPENSLLLFAVWAMTKKEKNRNQGITQVEKSIEPWKAQNISGLHYEDLQL